MGISVPNLLKERKFPFILLFSTLLICATILWYSNTNQSKSFTSSDLYRQINPLPTKPTPQNQPPTTPPPNTEGSNSRDIDNTSFSNPESKESGTQVVYYDAQWRLCNGTVAVDYIPCLDNMQAIKALPSRRHMEHRERYCPKPSPRCLVPMPNGYKLPVPWPKSRDMIWYDNVPHPKLVEYKKDQNWVKKVDNFLVFPGGGTQFKDGVTNYINFIEKTLPTIKWGTRTRVVLDVGCGVASFGGYLLDKDVITMSFAPKDEHEAQIQFALERGIPATLSVIGTQKLTFPDSAFDLIHCARCRVHWDADGGKPLIELNRILRPGGFFVWSATPVYRTNKRDSGIWNSMVSLTQSMCWEVVAKAVDSAGIGLVIYQKPKSYSCYEKRQKNDPPLCENDGQRISWYEPLDKCLARLSVDSKGSFLGWPTAWPSRLNSRPPSLANNSDAEQKFNDDTERWSVRLSDVYMHWLAINWTGIRNIMDMNAGYGGFAAALVGRPYWVMNVVPIGMPDTLPVIFDRGLIGLYHDWCESLSTYPRTYDLLHAHFLFETLTQRCDFIDVAVEMDRILRPRGYLLVQDKIEMIDKLNPILRSLHWETEVIGHEFLVGTKSYWRPSQ